LMGCRSAVARWESVEEGKVSLTIEKMSQLFRRKK
jgi:hypothetical protein